MPTTATFAPERAAAYRRSFRYYTEERLLVSMMFYAAACALFSGIFIVRYKLELILAVPVIAGLFAHYLHLGLQPDSPVQNPEKLMKERGFLLYMVLTFGLLMGLMFSEIPIMYKLFKVDPAGFPPLWRIG